MDQYIVLAIVLALVLFLVIFIACHIKIVPQAQVYVVERLGAYHSTWSTGLHMRVPFIDRIAKKVSLKEQVVDFQPQAVITKDNVTMQIDTVVFFQVTDAKLYTYGVERPVSAIENLTATTLRNIIGSLELDNTLTSRDPVSYTHLDVYKRQTARSPTLGPTKINKSESLAAVFALSCPCIPNMP